MKILYFTLIILIINTPILRAQSSLSGTVSNHDRPVLGATIQIPSLKTGTATDTAGHFMIAGLPVGRHYVHVSGISYQPIDITVSLKAGDNVINIDLLDNAAEMDEVVITGTMKEVSRTDSPIPVEVMTPKFFKKNPTPSLFEAVGMINGVKPQLNCNVCNTGDIHINGMEGPYTMILIDGMPIVSSLSTVYGLSGIPNSIVERIEVVKGPASSLYGTEAMGGIINVITKNPSRAPLFSVDVFGTSWGELSTDIAAKLSSQRLKSLFGINYFNYQLPTDKNGDNFTDVTLQHRVSLFNKWTLDRKDKRVASLGVRYVYEDRWGGEMQYGKEWRGTDSVYGESIYTRRIELLGSYQLPVKEKIITQFSYNWHDQNSFYGKIPYMATQQVAFAQAFWDKNIGTCHSLLAGTSVRYIHYDDNTPATQRINGLNNPSITVLPGLFFQDEWAFHPRHTLLAGYRYDYNVLHGSIHSPRLAYKWSPGKSNTVRAAFGTGFRVVNLFTEDHAALTGAREVVITEALLPERSYNGNLNYVTKITANGFWINIDLTGFYSHFTNKIIGDFDTDPQKIIYHNLRGYAVSRGASMNVDINFIFPLKVLAGVTFMDVYSVTDNASGVLQTARQLYAPKWSGTFAATYSFSKSLSADLTGSWYGPMRLPVVPHDYRPEYSPSYCVANIQLTKKWLSGIELYGGIKNLLNFIPANPILRPHDPFDKHVNDPANNPNGYTFDPSYNYAPLQGIRCFLGFRYSIQ